MAVATTNRLATTRNDCHPQSRCNKSSQEHPACKIDDVYLVQPSLGADTTDVQLGIQRWALHVPHSPHLFIPSAMHLGFKPLCRPKVVVVLCVTYLSSSVNQLSGQLHEHLCGVLSSPLVSFCTKSRIQRSINSFMKRTKSKKGLKSDIDDIDSDDDVPIYTGGTITKSGVKSRSVARENRQLLHALRVGQQYIGEYHAQLALDNIQLTEAFNQKTAEMKALTEREEQLESRLAFIFEDCKQLSKDNEEIVREGKRHDAELKELYSQLELQESKFRSANRVLNTEQTRHDQTFTLKTRSHQQYIQAREKLVKQHEYMWQTADMVDYLKVEVAHLQKQLQALEAKKLDPLTPRRGASDNTPPAAQNLVRSKVEQCERRDCRELREHLKAIQVEVQETIKKQRKRQQEKLEGSSTKGSRSIGDSSLLATGRSKHSAHQGSVEDHTLFSPYNQSTSSNRLQLSVSNSTLVASPSARSGGTSRRSRSVVLDASLDARKM